MCANFIRLISWALFKLLLLAIIVIAGIVFISDSFFDWVEGGSRAVFDCLFGEAQERAPEIKEDIGIQIQETKRDAGNIYQSAKEYLPAIGERIKQFLLFWN